jgi:hypothetical protein
MSERSPDVASGQAKAARSITMLEGCDRQVEAVC